MRIHYLASSAIVSDSANSIQVMKMCDAFKSIGHDVTLSAITGLEETEAAFRYYGLGQRFQLIRHDEKNHPFVGKLWALRGTLPWLRVGRIPSVVYGRVKIRPLLMQHRPDLVFGRNLSWMLGLPSDMAFVAESHRPPRNILESALERRLYQRPNFVRLVVISNKLKEMYLSIYPWLLSKILVAPDAADDPLPEVWRRPRQGGFHVGYVGHLYPGRGSELIVLLAREFPSVTFHVVGGNEGDRTRFAALAPTSNVILHGHHPPSALTKFFPMFDTVIAPYQRMVAAGAGGDISGFLSPLKLFEYMAWGKPILCSDLPVLREVIESGRNGLLVPPDDPKAWARALQRLIDDPDGRDNLGSRARADFLARYTWRERARRVLEPFANEQN
jgi:glycosyltransferase involved in cell wall biosynthesis